MKKSKILLCLMLVLVMAFSSFALIACDKTSNDASTEDTTTPENTTPEETTPEDTTPEDTITADMVVGVYTSEELYNETSTYDLSLFADGTFKYVRSSDGSYMEGSWSIATDSITLVVAETIKADGTASSLTNLVGCSFVLAATETDGDIALKVTTGYETVGLPAIFSMNMTASDTYYPIWNLTASIDVVGVYTSVEMYNETSSYDLSMFEDGTFSYVRSTDSSSMVGTWWSANGTITLKVSDTLKADGTSSALTNLVGYSFVLAATETDGDIALKVTTGYETVGLPAIFSMNMTASDSFYPVWNLTYSGEVVGDTAIPENDDVVEAPTYATAAGTYSYTGTNGTTYTFVLSADGTFVYTGGDDEIESGSYTIDGYVLSFPYDNEEDGTGAMELTYNGTSISGVAIVGYGMTFNWSFILVA